jgi:hypothetical protein
MAGRGNPRGRQATEAQSLACIFLVLMSANSCNVHSGRCSLTALSEAIGMSVFLEKQSNTSQYPFPHSSPPSPFNKNLFNASQEPSCTGLQNFSVKQTQLLKLTRKGHKGQKDGRHPSGPGRLPEGSDSRFIFYRKRKKGKVHARHSQWPVQRPRGRNLPDVFPRQEPGQCG